MGLNQLLEKIDAAQTKIFADLPLIMDKRASAATLSQGTFDYFDTRIMQRAMRELFVFEHYLLQLKEIKPSSDKEKEQTQTAISTIHSIISALYPIAGDGKYDETLNIQDKRFKQSHFYLIDAAKNNDNELFDASLVAGANVNFNYLNDCALIYAIRHKNYAMAEQLIKAGANPNVVVGHSSLSTPLIAAVESNDINLVKLLVEAGADINKQVFDTGNALFIACDRCVSFELFQYLLSTSGINLNDKFPGHRNQTALSAALDNMKETHDNRKVQALLKAGVVQIEADFDTAIDAGIDAVKLLLDAGYLCTENVLCEAIDHGDVDIIDLLVKQEHADIIGTKTSLKKYDHYTDLMFAVTIGDTEEVKRLLALSQTNIDVEHRKNENALMIAAKLGRTEIVQLLFAAGADVNHANRQGKTALYMATVTDHLNVIDVLLSKDNIDMSVKKKLAWNGEGESALMLGLHHNNKGIANLYKLHETTHQSITEKNGFMTETKENALKHHTELLNLKLISKKHDAHFNMVEPKVAYQEINSVFDEMYPDGKITKNEAKQFYNAATHFLDDQHAKLYNNQLNTSLILTILCCIPIITVPFSLLIFNNIFDALSKNIPIQRKRIIGSDIKSIGLENKINNCQDEILTKHSLFNEKNELRKIRGKEFIYGTKHQICH